MAEENTSDPTGITKEQFQPITSVVTSMHETQATYQGGNEEHFEETKGAINPEG